MIYRMLSICKTFKHSCYYSYFYIDIISQISCLNDKVYIMYTQFGQVCPLISKTSVDKWAKDMAG